MIKKILVALDPDSDTQVAMRMAIDIARRCDAEITGVAVVDMGSIDSSSRGGGIGSMYFAEKLRDRLTAEARSKAAELIDSFERIVSDTGVRYTDMVEEGVPFERIVEDMKYHDLLVVGKEPHFFYSHPKEATETLAKVVQSTVGPSLIVGDELRDVSKVIIAYDGSLSAASAMRSFVQTMPFGRELSIRLLNIHGAGGDSESSFLLDLADQYIRAHGLQAETVSLQVNDVSKGIVAQIEDWNADLIIAGAHTKKTFGKMSFGSTTKFLVKQCPVPLFLDC